ncbi:MAG TPA: histidine kinase dimerization/phospho-acceptor domain-containing protein [Blastocatellia bacterium]|nr:histidine kinase dimerization/phospho-acceptor domain-containing protein [Blastocatellia bacterium]
MGDNDQNEILELRATLTAKEQEITELRDKLEALNKAVATVRHDANNPLAVVLGQAQFLTTRIGGLPEDVNRRLKVIEEMSQRIRHTLNVLESFKQKPPVSQ